MHIIRRAFTIALLLAGSFAFAEEVPNAAQAAPKIGQTVTFQDEVKAVSFSRSTNGYYLSFGAPYPKQILSVWVAETLRAAAVHAQASQPHRPHHGAD